MTDKSESKAAAARRKKRKRMRWVKRVLVLVLALALAAAAVVALLPKPIAVDTVTAEKGPMVVTVSEDGKTRVEHRYIVTTPLSGIIPRLELHEGDDIKQGETLVQVVPATPPLLDARTKAEAQARLGAALADLKRAQATVSRAEAAAREAESVRDRERRLVAKNATAKTAVERAEFAAEARQADLSAAKFAVKVTGQQVASARAALGLVSKRGTAKKDSLVVESPVSGRILRVFRRDEGVVAAGTRLLELGDPATLEVVVDVLTRDAVKIHPGASAQIIRWGGPPLKGVVHRVEPSGFTRVSALGVQEQRVNVIIDIKAPREQYASLGDGFRVEAEVEIWRADEVLQVPASAVFRHGAGWAVFAVREGAARLVPVEIDHRNATHIEITKGIAEGQTIIIHPGDNIADGVEVISRTAE
ncbi:MAG: HlyD family efflux transporter periplasmic adaptor subunit [Deltaproteobacteria bacterium]|jgi:HlyD family secretion protein|nr:HlyD family efflux transporter periplasmic adaptor subunit [Deltaproteobacteria bacterium]